MQNYHLLLQPGIRQDVDYLHPTQRIFAGNDLFSQGHLLAGWNERCSIAKRP